MDDYVFDHGTWVNIGDAGDTLGSAADIPIDIWYGDGVAEGSAGIGTDSGDYYKFTAIANGEAFFDMYSMSADLDLKFYDSTGTLLDSSTASGSAQESIDYWVYTGYTYYIHVDPYGSAESDYHLEVDTPFGPVDWNDYVNGFYIGDAGDSLGSAAYVVLDHNGYAYADGAVGYGTDSGDYYEFTAMGSGDAIFDLDGLSDDIDLKLYDSTGILLSASTASGSTSESITYGVTAGSTYYVYVDPYLTAESNYDLDMYTPDGSSAGTDDIVNGSNIGDAGDSLGSAEYVNVEPYSGLSSILGSTGYGTDSGDYYEFTAMGSGNATFDLYGLSEDIDLKLYNSAGTLLSSSTAGGSASESITYGVTAGSAYYVYVDPYSSAESNYYLDMVTPDGSSAGSDDWVNVSNIGDAGDTLGSAAYVNVEDYFGYSSILGSTGIGSDSGDYYEFTALGSGDATFDLYGLSEDIDLRFYNSAGTQLSASTAGGSAAESITYGVTAGSTYYVYVDPYGASESNYYLDMATPEPGSAGSDDYLWDRTIGSYVNIGDAGDTAANAAYVDYYIGDVYGSAGYGSDSGDYYEITAQGSGEANFYLYGLSADIDLRLYNSAGTLLSSSEAGGGANEHITYSVTAGSTYYVYVDPYGTAESNYDLDMFTPEPGAAGSDDYIWNPAIGSYVNIGDAGDTFGSAAYVPLDSVSDGYADGSAGFGDDSGDYYEFTAEGSGDATFDLYGLSDDIDLKLYNSSGTQLAVSQAGGSTAESITYGVTAGSTYYVYVDPYGSAESNYSLDIATPEPGAAGSDDYIWNPTAGVWANVGDVGDTFGSATNVTLDSIGWGASVGSAGFGDDSGDYYEFTAEGSGDATFDLYNLSDDIDLKLYNSSGTQLAVSQAGGSTAESITYGVTAGSIYYVYVDPYGSAESEYWMEMYTPEPGAGGQDDVANGFWWYGDAGDTVDSAEDVDVEYYDGWAYVEGSAGFDSDSGDYYRFTALDDGVANFELDGLSADLDLKLYSWDGFTQTLLDSSTAGGSTTESISYDVRAGGTYYLQVDPYGSAESNYYLTLDTPEPVLASDADSDSIALAGVDSMQIDDAWMIA